MEAVEPESPEELEKGKLRSLAHRSRCTSACAHRGFPGSWLRWSNQFSGQERRLSQQPPGGAYALTSHARCAEEEARVTQGRGIGHRSPGDNGLTGFEPRPVGLHCPYLIFCPERAFYVFKKSSLLEVLHVSPFSPLPPLTSSSPTPSRAFKKNKNVGTQGAGKDFCRSRPFRNISGANTALAQLVQAASRYPKVVGLILGHIREATNKCISKLNNKSMSFSLSKSTE